MDEIHQFITKQPCYEQHVIEIKRIYEARLFTILVPNIYEGFKSLYNISEKIEQKSEENAKQNPNVEKMSVLVVFQKLISNIPNLTTHKIKGEADRIKTASRSADIFDELVKAVVKSNIILMTYNVDYKRKDLIQTRYHESIIVHDFVHSCYIEAARLFHGRPELFWTGYDSSIIINQNKRMCYEIIEDSIRESINLALPMKEILSEYLNNPYEMKEDIRIYVIGDTKPDSNLDLDGHNLQRYPGEFGGNGHLIKRGGHIGDGDEEYINAQDLIDRDLGAFVGNNNQVGSLLESESDNDGFEPGGRSNLSILLGSESDATRKDSMADSMADSLLEEDEIPHITPAESTKDNEHSEGGHSEGGHSEGGHSEGGHSEGGHLAESDASNNSNAVIDGVRMVGIKSSLGGRGQAKNFFNEILPDANKKAEKYRKQMREKSSSGDEKDSLKNHRISDVGHRSDSSKASDRTNESDVSDKSGIRITRTESAKVPTPRMSIKTEDITTDNVEDLLNDILTTKKSTR